MKRISWKAINAWIMFGLLLAPGLYLFGGYIGQLAGSHGEFMYAEPAIEGGVDYSVEYNGKSYKRFGDLRYQFNYFDQITFTLGLGSINVGYTNGEFIGDSVDNHYPTITMYIEEGNIFIDDLDSEWNICFSYICNSEFSIIYQEIFYDVTTDTYDYPSWHWENNQWNYDEYNPFEADYEMYDFFASAIEGLDHVAATEIPADANMPLTQPRVEAAPAIEPNAQGNTEFQQGQFFSRNNFLKKWGDSVMSQDETWGFAPFKALIQYLDENMLHFARNGVQYGLMAYGYMYYALHIVLLDLVFYITSFLPRILKKLAERLEGGLD